MGVDGTGNESRWKKLRMGEIAYQVMESFGGTLSVEDKLTLHHVPARRYGHI